MESEVGYPSLVPTVLNLTLLLDQKTSKNMIGNTVSIKIWWMTERRNTYQNFYAKDIDILADGYPHTYNLYLPPGGLAIQKIMIDGYPTGAKIRILNSVIRNLTFTEIQGKDIPYYY